MKLPQGISSDFSGMTIKQIWTYRDATKTVLGYVARYDDAHGNKKVIPYFNRENEIWKSGAPPEPRPLFGLDRLSGPSHTVYVVEGEKCAAAMHALGFACVSSLGGARAAGKADWQPLGQFKRIVILPDNDEAGEAYAHDVVAALGRLPEKRTVFISRLPELPQKGDVVDFLQGRIPMWDGFEPIPCEHVDDLRVELRKVIKENREPVHTDVDTPTVESEVSLLPFVDVANAGPPPPALFDLGIYRKKMSILGGESGCGKSFLALQLAASLALGESLLPGFTPTSGGRVLFLSGEDDAPIIKRRLTAIGEDRFNDILKGINFVTARCALIENLFENTPTLCPAFKELQNLAREHDLVVIDPLAQWFCVAENDASTMAAVCTELTNLAESADCAVLLVHHAGKANRAELGQHSLRGSSALAAAARFILTARLLPDKEVAKLDVELSDRFDFLEVAVAKNSYAERKGETFIYRRNGEGALKSCSLRDQRIDAIVETLAHALKDLDVSRRELEKNLKPDAKKVRKVLDDAHGRVTRDEVAAAITKGMLLCLIKTYTETSGPGRRRERLIAC